jgi:signal peptidase
MRRTTLATVVDAILICFILSLTCSAVVQRAYGLAWGWVGINGTSMSPTIAHGSLVFCLPARPESLKVGDIVVFRSQTVPPIVCHRIVGSSPEGWLTQGDATGRIDQAVGLPPVTETTLAGVVPQIGGRPVAIPALGGLAGGENASAPHFILALGLCFGFMAFGRSGGTGRQRRRRG